VLDERRAAVLARWRRVRSSSFENVLRETERCARGKEEASAMGSTSKRKPNDVEFDEGWCEWPKNSRSDFQKACRLAACALYAEDRALRAAMRADARTKYARERQWKGTERGAAFGLTYWLYETTLVYLIFRAWARRWYVKWDWARIGNSRRRLDLVLEVGRRSRECGLEAKWWNTRQGGWSMTYDQEKLRDWRRGNKQRREAFLVAFWWVEDPENAPKKVRKKYKDYVADRATQRSGKHLKITYRASFPTCGPQGMRRFFMDVYDAA
jgi:hypothetical protein